LSKTPEKTKNSQKLKKTQKTQKTGVFDLFQKTMVFSNPGHKVQQCSDSNASVHAQVQIYT
jgi:hypothetical protein